MRRMRNWPDVLGCSGRIEDRTVRLQVLTKLALLPVAALALCALLTRFVELPPLLLLVILMESAMPTADTKSPSSSPTRFGSEFEPYACHSRCTLSTKYYNQCLHLSAMSHGLCTHPKICQSSAALVAATAIAPHLAAQRT